MAGHGCLKTITAIKAGRCVSGSDPWQRVAERGESFFVFGTRANSKQAVKSADYVTRQRRFSHINPDTHDFNY